MNESNGAELDVLRKTLGFCFDLLRLRVRVQVFVGLANQAEWCPAGEYNNLYMGG